MQVKIDKTFEKDVKKITDKNTLKRIASAIRNTQDATNLKDIKKLRKLS